MIIDCHCHPNWLGHHGDAMIENMDEYGIDVAWVHTWEIEEGKSEPSYVGSIDPRWSHISLESVLEVCRAHPDRLVPFYAPDPRRPGALKRLQAAVDLHGIRGCGELKLRMCMDSPDALALYNLCGELGLPVTFHLDIPLPPQEPVTDWVWWYGGSLGAVERALQACPHTVFLGHAPGFWRYISGDADERAESYPDGPVVEGGELIRLFDTYPNLFADLSAGSGLNAVKRDPEFGKQFILDYQDRILYGRDQFDDVHLDFLRELNLPRDVWGKITSENALRLVPV